MSTIVQKWGDSLGIHIPQRLARQARLREGAQVKLTAEADRIVIQPLTVPSLEELVSQIEPDARPELVDWGNPVGKEVW